MTQIGTCDGASRPNTAPAESAAPLRRLVYRSVTAGPAALVGLNDLVRASQSRNRSAGVTGCLAQEGERFLQVLEGPGRAIDGLTRAIRKDRRHHSIDILSDRSDQERYFADWDMQLISREAPAAETVLAPDPRLITALTGAPDRLPDLLGALSKHASGATWRPADDADLCTETLLRLVVDSGGALDPRKLDTALTACSCEFRHFVLEVEAMSRALGRLWQTDAIDGATVSSSLAVLQGAVRRRSMRSPVPAREQGRVIVAVAPGERHLIGAQLKVALLRSEGWDVDLILPDRPITRRTARTNKPAEAMVVVGSRLFARPADRTALSAMIAAARARQPGHGLRVILAGAGMEAAPEHWSGLEVEALCPSASEIDRVLDRRGLASVA